MASTLKPLKYLKSYGYEEGTYLKVSSYINEGNHKKAALALIICCFVFIGMGALRLFGVSSDLSVPIFVALTLISLVFYFGESKLYLKSPYISTAAFYVAFALIFVYTVAIGVFATPHDRTVTICLLLCAFPSLLTDRPWRIVCLSAFAAAVFLCLDFQFKDFGIARADAINTVCSLVIGLLIGLSAQKTRIDNYVDRHAKACAMQTDGLTGILNKTAFEEESAFVIEAGMTGALLIIDADNFKHVNDAYGHAKGDDVI